MNTPSLPRYNTRTWTWGALLLILLLVTTVRTRVLDCPLERDEGEYAYMGQLMLHGVPPYELAYTMKLPGTGAAYALIMAVLGENIVAIHSGLLLVDLATILLVFLIARRLFDSRTGVLAAANFALLSISPVFYGYMAHATHFVLLPAMIGVFLLAGKRVEELRARMLVLAGMMMGLAFTMKQSGVPFILFGAVWIFWSQWRTLPARRNLTRLAGYLAGAVFPWLFLCAWLWWCGVFGHFWFWTVSYAERYGSLLTPAQGWVYFEHAVARIATQETWIFLLAALGLVTLFIPPVKNRPVGFVSTLLIFSFLAVCPGFYFRMHYFVLMLPVVAILAAAAIGWLCDLLSRTKRFRVLKDALPLFLWACGVANIIAMHWGYFAVTTPMEISRFTYGVNPFIESIPIADYLHKHTAPGQAIFVAGSEPQIYFYAQRPSVTGYIYMYGLMEQQSYALQMQKELISQIEKTKPLYIVTVNVYDSWIQRPKSATLILQWLQEYTAKNYEIAGIIDITPHGTVYRWDEMARNYTPTSTSFVIVRHRKDAPAVN